MKRVLRLAITGGIGAGKSEALAAFGRHGAAVLSSDEVVHSLISKDEDVRQALEERFGTTDRARIAEVVFGDRRELEWLESLLHRRVRRTYAAWLASLDEVRLAVVEVPLLYETGADALFDAVLLITAPEEVRRRRSGANVGDRSSRLIADDEKARRADFVYVNDGTLEALDAFVSEVLRRLQVDT